MQTGNTKATLDGKLLFPSAYVAAVEFKGRDVTLTIKSVAREEMKMQGNVSKNAPVVSFVETRKKFVLNKTNSGTIADIYGTKAEDWVGKKVTLYPTRTQCGRNTVDCIRVRDTRPKGAPSQNQFDEPEAQDIDE